MGNDDQRNCLDTFEDRKRRIVEFTADLRQLASDSGDTGAVAILDDFMERFRANRLLLLVVGDFKSGKSTLVNAIVGRPICPVKATPRTAKITRITGAAGANESVEIHFHKDRPVEKCAFEEGRLDDLVAVNGARTHEVRFVDVSLRPGDTLLRHHLTLVDTPGLGSTDEDHSRTTRDFVQHADALIFVFYGPKPFSESERDFLLTFRPLLDRTVFVVNQIDSVEPEERQEVLEHILAGLKKDVLPPGAPQPALIPVSGKQGLKAHKENDAAALAASGLPAVVAAIQHKLGGAKANMLLRTLAQQQLEVCDLVTRRVVLARTAVATERRAVANLRNRVQGLPSQLENEAGKARNLSQQLHAWEQRIITRHPQVMQTLRAKLVDRILGWVNACPSEAVCKKDLPAFLAKLLTDTLQAIDNDLARGYNKVNLDVYNQLAATISSMESMTQAVIEPGAAAATSNSALARGVAALSGMSALASDIGGPVEGYGIAVEAVSKALAPSKEVEFLSVAAAISVLVAGFAGPVGWVIAGITGLLAALLGFDYSTGWRQRVHSAVVERLDNDVLPNVSQAIQASIRNYFRGVTVEIAERTSDVKGWLEGVAFAVLGEAEREDQGRDAELKRLKARDERVRELKLAIQEFLGGVPAESAASTASASETVAEVV